ncbi:MAG: hypothetical protein ABI947_18805 [Chloroflexota bacterium]
MTNKRPKLKPSEILLPARMSLNMEALSDVHFAVLDFPYEKALRTFTNTLRDRYNTKNNRPKN